MAVTDRGDEPISARLKVVDGTDADDFVFQLNPSKIMRSRAPRYAPVPVALADHGPSDPAGTPAQFEWTGNSPEEIHVEFLMHRVENGTDVEDDLAKLDRIMQKDPRTGEPPDLLFAMGARWDRVRIFNKEVEELMFTPMLDVQSARVRLTFRTVRFRST